MFKTQTDSLKYGYATGRIKVLETRLLDKPRVERLIGARDLEEALHILTETDYGGFLEGVETQAQLEKALESILLKLYLFLKELREDPEVVSFFRLKYDFYNLKVLLKAKHLGEPPFFFENLGYLKKAELERIKSLIEEGKVKEIPENFREAVAEAQKKLAETKKLRTIDSTLDKYLYQKLQRLSLKLKNEYLQELTKTLIDLTNLKAFLRAKNLKLNQETFEEALLEGGFVAKGTWFSLFPEALNNLVAAMKKTPYQELLEKTEEGQINLSFFDKLSESFILKLARKAKLVAAGLEPIVGYILAKENEVNILRIVLKGKLKGLSPKEIELRARELYV